MSQELFGDVDIFNDDEAIADWFLDEDLKLSQSSQKSEVCFNDVQFDEKLPAEQTDSALNFLKYSVAEQNAGHNLMDGIDAVKGYSIMLQENEQKYPDLKALLSINASEEADSSSNTTTYNVKKIVLPLCSMSPDCLPEEFVQLPSSTTEEIVNENEEVVSESVRYSAGKHHSLSSSQCTDVSDNELVTLSVRQLNMRLQSLPRDKVQRIKARRRRLKNRGYAQNCRIKRISQSNQSTEENKQLHLELEELKRRLQQMTTERDHYKCCYESLMSLQ